MGHLPAPSPVCSILNFIAQGSHSLSPCGRGSMVCRHSCRCRFSWLSQDFEVLHISICIMPKTISTSDKQSGDRWCMFLSAGTLIMDVSASRHMLSPNTKKLWKPWRREPLLKQYLKFSNTTLNAHSWNETMAYFMVILISHNKHHYSTIAGKWWTGNDKGKLVMA